MCVYNYILTLSSAMCALVCTCVYVCPTCMDMCLLAMYMFVICVHYVCVQFAYINSVSDILNHLSLLGKRDSRGSQVSQSIHGCTQRSHIIIA